MAYTPNEFERGFDDAMLTIRRMIEEGYSLDELDDELFDALQFVEHPSVTA